MVAFLATLGLLGALPAVRASAYVTPQDIVEQYCRMDFEGARLRPETYPRVEPLVNYELEGGWDSAVVVAGYTVEEGKIVRDRAEVPVKYEVLGFMNGVEWQPVKPDDPEDKLLSDYGSVVVPLEETEEEGWRIAGPILYPRASLPAVLVNLIRLQESGSVDEESGPVLAQSIQTLKDLLKSRRK